MLNGVALAESAFFSERSPSPRIARSSSPKIGGQQVGIVINFPFPCAVISAHPSVPGAGQDAEIEIVTLSDPSTLAPSDVSAIALDFKVLHPVVITRLGVFTSGTRPELQSNVTVKLLQLDQEVTEPQPVSLEADPVLVLFTASVID